ncbi:MAG: inorganic pyrophosphatase [Gemmatimonadetes bacterium]|nr:inorganic pyrophosphatase [Gemmatimonadota bacterium]MYD25647.1 inorganic pyrophosphatase [Gemmatimonadota bacterium]MYI98625.1 inorganic pyrophosphatase [Gemmatimonadota bacterium]
MEPRVFIGQIVDIEIDRPMGSKHPDHNLIYPVNYGLVPGVSGSDGEELDAYLLGVDRPVKRFTGRCIAVIRRSDDADDKLVVVPDGKHYTNEQIRGLTEFQERYFKSSILRGGHP